MNFIKILPFCLFIASYISGNFLSKEASLVKSLSYREQNLLVNGYCKHYDIPYPIFKIIFEIVNEKTFKGNDLDYVNIENEALKGGTFENLRIKIGKLKNVRNLNGTSCRYSIILGKHNYAISRQLSKDLTFISRKMYPMLKKDSERKTLLYILSILYCGFCDYKEDISKYNISILYGYFWLWFFCSKHLGNSSTEDFFQKNSFKGFMESALQSCWTKHENFRTGSPQTITIVNDEDLEHEDIMKYSQKFDQAIDDEKGEGLINICIAGQDISFAPTKSNMYLQAALKNFKSLKSNTFIEEKNRKEAAKIAYVLWKITQLNTKFSVVFNYLKCQYRLMKLQECLSENNKSDIHYQGIEEIFFLADIRYNR